MAGKFPPETLQLSYTESKKQAMQQTPGIVAAPLASGRN